MKKILLLTLVLAALLLPAMTGSAGAQADEDVVWSKEFGNYGKDIRQVQFTPDGEHIAAAIGRGVFILDKNTGEIVKQFTGFMTSCNSFVIFEDKNWLVTTSDGNKVIIWDYQTTDTIRMYNICLYSIKKYDDHSIVGMGNLINEWNEDSTRIDVFDLNTGEIVKRQWPENSHLKFEYLTLEVSKEKNLIAAQDFLYGYQVALFDLTTLEPVARLQPGLKLQNDMAFSSDGKYIASAGSDGIVHVWDVDSKQLVSTLHFDDELQEVTVRYIQFTPNGGYLVAGGGVFGNLSTKIFKIPSLDIVYSYKYGAVHGLDITNDSTLIAIGSGGILILLNAHWGSTEVAEAPNGTAKVLYPNPATGEVSIKIDDRTLKDAVVKVYDVRGECVLEQPVQNALRSSPSSGGGQVRLDVSGLSPGVYFVRVGDKVLKFVKL